MRVRFRVGLMGAVLMLLLGTTVLIAGTSYVNARANANELASQVMTQAIGRIDARIRAQLEPAVEQSRLNELLLDRSVLSPDDLDAFGSYLLDALAAHQELSFLSFSLESNGTLCSVQRTLQGMQILRFLREQGGGQLELFDYARRDGKLELLRRVPNMKENEARPRPFYVAAKAARHAIWTESYLFFGEEAALQSTGVSYATPRMRADGSLVGVLTADFDLRAISQFLGTLQILEHGLAFLVEYREDGTRRVIAHPNPQILTRRTAGGESEATPISALSDRRVVSLLGIVPETFPRADEAFPEVVPFKLDQTTYRGSFRAVQEGGLRWVVCVVAPEDDILGAVARNNRITSEIVLGSLLVALVLALWLGTELSRPIIALAKDAEAIGRFELASRPIPQSSRMRIIEVETLTAALDEMKRGLRSFRKYVPVDLVRDLLASGREAEVGGERLELTIHFSDIAGFTSVAETLDPERLVVELGEYLVEMTRPIEASGGTVDKYIGDAIMAFWGAPRPDAAHALHACEAALENRDRLDALNQRWRAMGRAELQARVALHTGEVVVGNVGSSARLNYTIIGDAVNLASRLEGLNKHYGTRLIISETTWAEVSEHMVCRPLDKVSVKGKEASVVIYELIGQKGKVDPDVAQAADRHGLAFSYYLERNWSQAIALLKALLERTPGDVPSKILLERCERWTVTPPGSDWDGTERMTTK